MNPPDRANQAGRTHSHFPMPLRRRCPKCDAAPGFRCIRVGRTAWAGGSVLKKPHKERKAKL